MGMHLYNFLGTKPEEIKRIPFNKNYFENPELLQKFVSECDVVVHLAAMNRHEDASFIYDTNIQLVKNLIGACKAKNATPKIIFSSSTQEEKDNLYGNSKKEGRKAFEDWAKINQASVVSCIIPNVFGPFGKPNYNSVVSTFCHKLTHNETPIIINDSKVNLIYINELSEILYNHIISDDEGILVDKINHTSTKNVSAILKLLQGYKESYFENGIVPDLSVPFEKALFNTFTSYIPKNYFPRNFTKHVDNRGAFVEIMRANTPGQSSFSTTVPGITRGNHYHTRKVERFAVISGKASIKLRKINTDDVFEYFLDGETPSYVDMPIWYTHNITNIGHEELITLFWINEPYDATDPDTYFETV